jgi:hypothetical protein
MAISLAAALDEIASVAARASHAEHLSSLRRRFVERTGAFGPEDPWFEARSRAFFEWTLTRGGFGRRIEQELSPEARAFVGPLERAHRGLFTVAPRGERTRAAKGDALVLRDEIAGPEFAGEPLDAGLADALSAAESPFDGYLVGVPLPDARVFLLPGAVFHPESAKQPIARVLDEARARGMEREDILDALLRMERSYRSLSRVKPSFAYRLQIH